MQGCQHCHTCERCRLSQQPSGWHPVAPLVQILSPSGAPPPLTTLPSQPAAIPWQSCTYGASLCKQHWNRCANSKIRRATAHQHAALLMGWHQGPAASWVSFLSSMAASKIGRGSVPGLTHTGSYCKTWQCASRVCMLHSPSELIRHDLLTLHCHVESWMNASINR